MSAIDFILYTERMVGEGSPDYADTLNRALKTVVSLSDADEDDFGGFALKPAVAPTANQFYRATGTGSAAEWVTLVSAMISDLTTAATGITKLGTVDTGVWHGTAIANAYIAAGLDVAKLTTGTALPTNIVTSSLTAVATITSGTWQGTAIADAYLVALAASKLTGTTLPTNIITSSLTAVGTIATGVWQGTSVSTTYTDAKIKTVTGTSNRLTIGGTATDPTFDLSTSYVGQATITTLGTVTTGTWAASTITVDKGGTNLTGFSVGDIIYASGATTLSKLAVGTAAQILIVNGGATAPAWHTLVTADITDLTSATTGITKVGTVTTGVWNAGVVAPTYGGTGVNNGSATITIAGNLATSGANALTLTTTGPTNVTLPTTGTLVNTAVTSLASLTSVGGAFAISGALTGVTGMTFSTTVISTTAQANLSALSATQFSAYASTAGGATLQGFGTTGDVTLKNRAGTSVLYVGPNSTTVTTAGALVISGALSGVSTITTSSAIEVNQTGGGQLLRLHGATTQAQYLEFNNTGNTTYIGTESSAGGGLFTGTSAYATVIGSVNNVPTQVVANNTMVASFSSTGLAMSTLAVSGVTNLTMNGTLNNNGGNFTVSSAGAVFAQSTLTANGAVTFGDVLLFNAASFPGSRFMLAQPSAGQSAYFQMLTNTGSGLIGVDRSGNNIFTGTSAGDLGIYTNASTGIAFGVNSTLNWRINSSGHLTAGTDATYDIGTSGALRPRHVYLSGSITTGDPGSGAVTWQLGNYLAATVVLDTTHCVEVKIAGTLRKLAIVT